MTKRKATLSIFLGLVTYAYLVFIPTLSSIENAITIAQWGQLSSTEVKETVSCTPKNHIMFLKTHKCGSSTLQNIFLKYGAKHNLTFALPASGNYLGNPLHFQKYMLPKSLLPPSGLVDIFCVHSRLNISSMKSILPNDTVWITILREPVSLFESIYGYYHLERYFHKSLEKLTSSPIELLKKLPRRSSKFGFNQMLFDLGADPNIEINELHRKIEEIDALFDMVLIVEKFEESLILMKEKLCWTTDDIVVFTKNARHRKTKMTSSAINKIRDYNSADVILYQHFLQKHNELVLRFGEDRMRREVADFKSKVADTYDECVAEEVTGRDSRLSFKEYSDQVSTYIQFKNSSEECEMLTSPELVFVENVRRNQFFNLKKLKKKDLP